MSKFLKHPSVPSFLLIIALLGLWLMTKVMDKPKESSIDDMITEVAPPESLQPIEPPAPVVPLNIKAVDPALMQNVQLVNIWTCKHATGWAPPNVQPGSIKQMPETDPALQTFIADPDWNCEASFQVGAPY